MEKDLKALYWIQLIDGILERQITAEVDTIHLRMKNIAREVV